MMVFAKQVGVALPAVMATLALTLGSTASPAVKLSADTTALIMCGTTCPTPDEFWVESVKNQFVAPTHPGQDIDYVGVTAPMEFWPITGLFRLVLLAVGPLNYGGLVARGGRMSRGGNYPGSSTSPPINRCRPGRTIWRRRWPRTAMTIW
jgi:hypothetical protein